ncbi:MAG: glycerol-3-phosphate dehydrogenase/oxidase [Flavobacteriaceae bacterium]|nr:glycerol-3-phosphate dehydrogenase/oxidase [Flavobacteriaceae bacterium]
MKREELIDKIKDTKKWDVVVIGGGASGLGVALDAISRGFKTVLFEGVDFAKGTSSKSTKLVHGGVRYLAQGDVGLVVEALKERGLLAKNARHLFQNQTFIIPNYKWWEGYYYAFGLKLYDLLSIRLSLGKSRLISKNETIQKLPTLKSSNLYSGVTYQDGQFDDSRLAVNLVQTAIENDGTVINHMKVIDIIKKNELVTGVKVKDGETGEEFEVNSKVVINATGIFTDNILSLNNKNHKQTVVPSQGVHLVLDKSFLNSEKAILIPNTSDGRVLFIIPWNGKVIAGTTDTLIETHRLEPVALESEIDFILNTIEAYLIRKPEREEVLSVFAGLRPLAAPKDKNAKTKEVSRSHKILVSDSKLISIIGGKWTTYRKMGEDVIDKAIEVHNLPNKKSKTRNLAIHGNIDDGKVSSKNHLYIYGSDLDAIHKLQSEKKEYLKKIHPDYNFTVAEVIWSVRNEMARTVEDVLARRVRLLFLDARAAIQASPIVARIMANELNKNEAWATKQETEFKDLAKNYILT